MFLSFTLKVSVENNNKYLLKKFSFTIWYESKGNYKVKKILKGSLDLIRSPSGSVKIQIMGGKVYLS